MKIQQPRQAWGEESHKDLNPFFTQTLAMNFEWKLYGRVSGGS
jgi:hypothetical protein